MAAVPSIRTCIGCRRRDAVTALVRLALDGERLVLPGRPPQGRARPSGRGASIHPSAACVQKAVKIGAFARAFRRRVELLDESLLLQQLTTARTQG